MADNRKEEAIELVARQILLELIGGDDVVGEKVDHELPELSADQHDAIEEQIMAIVEAHIFVDETRSEAAYEYLAQLNREEDNDDVQDGEGAGDG